MKVKSLRYSVSSLFLLANPVQQLEGHRCYWCGPLAEQVHRSQRAAKCNGDKSKVTICDEDLPYCAIVASSPPYVESRYCVKFYQDECYPLYCNTTKIWKVICPCRGELCNGPNTKRENEVFEALHKLTQPQRLKRALISNGGFLGVITSRNKSNNVDQNVDAQNDDVRNKENENAANSIIESADNDKHYTDKISEMDPTVNLVTLQAEVLTSLNYETTNVRVSSSDNVEMTSSETTENTKAVASEHSESTAATVTAGYLETTGAETSSVVSNIAVTTPADNNSADTTTTASNVEDGTIINEVTVPKDTSQTNNTNTLNVVGVESNKNEANKLIEIPISGFDSDDLKIDTHVMSSDHPNPVNNMDIKTEIIDSMQTNTTETKSMTEATTTKETTEIEKSKSSENLPPAEALQHNDTPATKTMERMNTSSTTVMSLLNTHIAQTTLPTIPRNNTATRMDAKLLTMIIGLVLQY